MSCTYEKLSSNKVKLSFTVSAEDFENAIVKAYRKSVSRINIPGFRRGKAPRHVIEMHYGKGVFYEDALDDLLYTLEEKFRQIKGGKGIAVSVPFSSVIGTAVYGFLANDPGTRKEETT